MIISESSTFATTPQGVDAQRCEDSLTNSNWTNTGFLMGCPWKTKDHEYILRKLPFARSQYFIQTGTEPLNTILRKKPM